jgi:hypothetical protein
MIIGLADWHLLIRGYLSTSETGFCYSFGITTVLISTLSLYIFLYFF